MEKNAKKIALVGRILLGAAFTVFGLNGFLNFMQPPPPSEAGGALLGAMAQSGYMFPLIKGTETVAGLMLLTGFRAPLALVLLMPIEINIVLFHLALDPSGTGLPLVLLAITLGLAYYYRRSYGPLLRSEKAQHTVGHSAEGAGAASF